jgi:glycosyltransferase involved in cell wall biosynthesis
MRSVGDSQFIVLANGTSGSPPASGLVEYLVAQGARQTTTVFHPLAVEDGNRHEITTYGPHSESQTRIVRLPVRLPYTYPVDVLVPLRPPRVDGWFAFNNLLCLRGLLERRVRPATTVAYWAVDFVPDRFGTDARLTKIYDRVDAYCCHHADLRIELSEAALEGRNARHRIKAGNGARTLIAPVGAWVGQAPVTPEDGWRSRRVVFVGHLVERMGGDTVIKAMSLLVERGSDVVADIAGHGPLKERLQSEVAAKGLGKKIHFHGFISDRRKLDRLLANAAVALAPYSTRGESFTRYADPSKLKSYLAAGLPILMTGVPPNTSDLAAHAGAQVLPDNPEAFADAIEHTLANADEWRRRRAAARRYVQRFDWNTIVGDVLKAAGFEP